MTTRPAPSLVWLHLRGALRRRDRGRLLRDPAPGHAGGTGGDVAPVPPSPLCGAAAAQHGRRWRRRRRRMPTTGGAALLAVPAAVRRHGRRGRRRRPRSAAARCASSPTATRRSPPIPIAIASTSSISPRHAGALATVALNAGDEPGRVVADAAGRVHVALRRGGALVSIDTDHRRDRSSAAPSARRRAASRTTRRPTSCTSRARTASW